MFSPFTFLDYYGIYKEKESFYIDDNTLPSNVVAFPGTGFEIIKDSILNEDPILVPYEKENSTIDLIPVIKADKYLPKYSYIYKRPEYMEICINNDTMPIWIKGKRRLDSLNSETLTTYSNFTQAICFWISLIIEDLKIHLQILKYPFIKIEFDLPKEELFKDHTKIYHKSHNLTNEFTIAVKASTIKLNIPLSIDGYIGANDNEGERILIEKILNGFALILTNEKLSNTLTNENISRLIDKHCPLGLKKMLLLSYTKEDIGLDTRNLTKVRYIQNASRQIILDQLVNLLNDKCPPAGKIKDKNKKRELTKNIVISALLPKLEEEISKYDSIDLLKSLMALYERLLYENSFSKINTTTRIECFSQYEDVLDEIKEEFRRLDETSVSVRCLIEHLSAQPSFGKEIISIETIDTLISIMSLIIFWGSVGDQIQYDLFDIELSVLPSRRIGTNSKDIMNNFFEDFKKRRTHEYVKDNQYAFFPKPDEVLTSNPAPENLNSSFIEEVGIAIAKLGAFIEILSHLGLSQTEPVASLQRSDLNYEINKDSIVHYSEEEIEAAFQFLSLKNRDSVKNIPNGFDSTDISPWRYNRRLSYLQRPIVYVNYGRYGNNPILLWTPRSMNSGWVVFNNLIHSGRFKTKAKSKLEASISKITKERRMALQIKAFEWFHSNTLLLIRQEVGISSHGALKNNKNLGDIDILIVDNLNKIILSIECKRTEPSRNSKEVVEEVEKYLNKKNGYILKHKNRHDWLVNNKYLVGQYFHIDTSQFVVHSLFITNESLAIQFMKNIKLEMPFISMYDLSDKSYADFLILIGINR